MAEAEAAPQRQALESASAPAGSLPALKQHVEQLEPPAGVFRAADVTKFVVDEAARAAVTEK